MENTDEELQTLETTVPVHSMLGSFNTVVSNVEATQIVNTIIDTLVDGLSAYMAEGITPDYSDMLTPHNIGSMPRNVAVDAERDMIRIFSILTSHVVRHRLMNTPLKYRGLTGYNVTIRVN